MVSGPIDDFPEFRNIVNELEQNNVVKKMKYKYAGTDYNAFTDTLTKTIYIGRGVLSLPIDEQKACLLHEVGHTKNSDISIWGYAGIIVITLLISILPYMGLILIPLQAYTAFLFFVLTIILIIVLPILVIIARLLNLSERKKEVEFRCDKYSALIVGKEPMIKLLNRFKENPDLTDINQKLWLKFAYVYVFIGSALIGPQYPSIEDRIARLENL